MAIRIFTFFKPDAHPDPLPLMSFKQKLKLNLIQSHLQIKQKRYFVTEYPLSFNWYPLSS